MKRKKVLIQYTHDLETQKYIREKAPNTMDVFFASSTENLPNEIHGIDILYGHIDKQSLVKADKLSWVQSHATGVENMLYPEFIQSNITLTNIKGILAVPIAEHVFALLLSLTRNTELWYKKKQEKAWEITKGFEISALTIGVVGLGSIGREVVKRARAFGLHVIGMDPSLSVAPEGVSVLYKTNITSMLGECDIVVSCCPATKENYHMFSEDEFNSIRKGGYFINVGRGGVVDEKALYKALMEKHLAGVGLDVTEEEPYPPSGPLWECEKIIITAHSSAYTQHLNKRKIDFFLSNLQRYHNGEALVNVVNLDKGF